MHAFGSWGDEKGDLEWRVLSVLHSTLALAGGEVQRDDFDDALGAPHLHRRTNRLPTTRSLWSSRENRRGGPVCAVHGSKAFRQRCGSLLRNCFERKDAVDGTRRSLSFLSQKRERCNKHRDLPLSAPGDCEPVPPAMVLWPCFLLRAPSSWHSSQSGLSAFAVAPQQWHLPPPQLHPTHHRARRSLCPSFSHHCSIETRVGRIALLLSVAVTLRPSETAETWDRPSPAFVVCGGLIFATTSSHSIAGSCGLAEPKPSPSCPASSTSSQRKEKQMQTKKKRSPPRRRNRCGRAATPPKKG